MSKLDTLGNVAMYMTRGTDMVTLGTPVERCKDAGEVFGTRTRIEQRTSRKSRHLVLDDRY